MGNYSLVANSTFKAKDFDEMIKPYMMYTADYNAKEEALSELATKADIWQGLANEQTDPVAYAQYTNYANALKDQAAIIASSGLNPTSRQTLLNLKRRYASEIAPIETAYNTRKAQAEEQRKALLQNPTLLLSRRADTTSLDDYMKNPNLGYDAYSGALLTQQVGQAAANIAKELRNYGKGKALDGFTKTWLQQHGYSASEVAFAINHPDDPRASEVLNTIVNNVMSDSGIANWADNNTLNQAYNYARQGLWNAVGQTQVGTYTDEDAKMTAQENIRINNAIKAEEMARLQNLLDGITPNHERRNVRTPEEIEKIDKDAEDWEKLKKYFYKDHNGFYVLNAEGRKQPLSKTLSGGSSTGTVTPVDTDLGSFLKRHNLTALYEGRPGPAQTARIDAMLHGIKNIVDTNTAIEYYRNVTPSQYDDVIAILNRNAKEGTIYNYSRRKTDNSYEWTRGEKVEVSKLTSGDIKSALVVFGEHGDFLEVKLKDGSTVDIPVSSYSDRYNNLLQGNASTIRGFKRMQEEGKTHFNNRDGIVLPIEDWINLELNAAGDNIMSSLGSSQIDPAKVKRGDYAIQVQ